MLYVSFENHMAKCIILYGVILRKIYAIAWFSAETHNAIMRGIHALINMASFGNAY